MTTVRAVVVNWNSWWFTRRCVASLLASETSFGELEIVVVDNGSVDGSLERLRHEFGDSVRFLDNGKNLGFAEACNRGIGDLRGVDHVALVNNDAIVEPSCITELVGVLTERRDAGAAAARMVLEPSFAALDLVVDGRCTLERVEVDGVDATDRVQSADLTLHGNPEWPLELWREAVGSVRLLVPTGDGRRVSMTVSGEGSMTVATGAGVAETALGHRPRTLDVVVDDVRVELLNGLGTEWNPDLESFDRRFGEVADPVSVPELAGGPREVAGFCGGGVLLRARMLDEVGAFDPCFFAYYEDTDLARRAERSGWATVSAPSAVVRHAFGGSGGARAPGFFFLNYRNWLLASLRDPTPAQRRVVRAALTERVRIAVRSNILSRLRHRRLPSLTLPLAWLRVLAGFATARLVSRLRRRGRPLGRRPARFVRLPFQPRFPPRAPGPRPGGPVVVHLELDPTAGGDLGTGSDPLTRRLLVPPAEVANHLEVLPVVATSDAVRMATPAEVARALGGPPTAPRPIAPLVPARAAPRTVTVRVDPHGWTACVAGQGDRSVRRFVWRADQRGVAFEDLTAGELGSLVDAVSSLVAPDRQ